MQTKYRVTHASGYIEFLSREAAELCAVELDGVITEIKFEVPVNAIEITEPQGE